MAFSVKVIVDTKLSALQRVALIDMDFLNTLAASYFRDQSGDTSVVRIRYVRKQDRNIQTKLFHCSDASQELLAR